MTRDPGRLRRVRGQALVEFAFALPVFTIFVFSVIQLSLIFITYYSETVMAQQTARSLAVASTSTDLQVALQVQSTMLPGLVGGTPTWCNPVLPASGCRFTPNNLTTDTVYLVGNMLMQFTPCVSNILPTSGPPCSNADRATGRTLHGQMGYNVANLLFLPSTFRIGSLTAAIPTTLPAYRVSVMVE